MFRTIVLLFALSIQPAFGFDNITTPVLIAAALSDDVVQEPQQPNALDVLPVITNVDKHAGKKTKYWVYGIAVSFIVLVLSQIYLSINHNKNVRRKASGQPKIKDSWASMLTPLVAVAGIVICMFGGLFASHTGFEGKRQNVCVNKIKHKHFIDYQYTEVPRLVNIDIKTPVTHYDRPVNERLFELTVETLDGISKDPVYYDCSWTKHQYTVIERPSNIGLANYPY